MEASRDEKIKEATRRMERLVAGCDELIEQAEREIAALKEQRQHALALISGWKGLEGCEPGDNKILADALRNAERHADQIINQGPRIIKIMRVGMQV